MKRVLPPRLLPMVLAVLTASTGCAPLGDILNTGGFVERRDLTVSSLVGEGLTLYNQNRFFEAELRLLQALYLAPERPALLLDLAKVYEAEARYDEARDLFLRVLERDRSNTSILSALGQLSLKEGKFDEARRWFREAEQARSPSEDLIGFVQLLRNQSVGEFLAGNEEDALCYSYRAAWWEDGNVQMNRHLKLMIGMGLYDATKALMDRLAVEKPGIKETAPFNHYKALLAFRNGEMEDVLHAEDRALDRQLPDDGIESDIALVRYLAFRKLGILEPDLESEAPLEGDTESINPMEMDLPERARAAALEYERRGPVATLFWPVPLIEEFLVFAAEVKESQDD